MRSSLLRKLFLIFISIVTVFVILTSGLYIIISKKIYTDIKTNELTPKANTISDFVLLYRSGGISLQYFSNIVSAGPSAWDAWVFVLDTKGKMIVETTIPKENDPEGSFVKAIESKTNDVLAGNHVEFTGSLPNDKFKMMIVGIPIIDKSKIVGAVFLAKPLYEINAGINSLNRALLLSTLVCLILMAVPAALAFKTLIKPLKETREVALAMAEGDFSVRARIYSDDEIGDLASSFNFLAERLEKTVSDLVTERNRLVRILNGLTEGIIAVDKNCNVTHANPALWNITQTTKLGQSFDNSYSQGQRAIVVRPNNPQFIRNQVISDESIWEDFRNVIHTSVPITREISKNKSIIRIIITPIEDESGKITGAVGLLRDITEAALLEKTRKDYVANISHELRTPLTAMRGLVEPLADGLVRSEEDRNRYYSIILRETMRLSRLIEDMMELSRLQSGKTTIEKKPFNIANTINDVLNKYIPIANERNIILQSSDKIELIPTVFGNPDRIEQILVILVDNALKFTSEGGKIFIDAKPNRENNPSKILVSVSDDGAGIPPDMLHYVFERFFKADKARYSSEGTGLGLSIAKEILSAMDEDIFVKSKLNEGSVFTFTLTIKQ